MKTSRGKDRSSDPLRTRNPNAVEILEKAVAYNKQDITAHLPFIPHRQTAPGSLADSGGQKQLFTTDRLSPKDVRERSPSVGSQATVRNKYTQRRRAISETLHPPEASNAPQAKNSLTAGGNSGQTNVKAFIRTHSSPAFLTEAVRRLPLSMKTDSELTDNDLTDFFKKLASESLGMLPLAKLSSPIFKISDNIESPSSEFGCGTPPQLFQISPHSWSELAGMALERERKISLSKRPASRASSDGDSTDRPDSETSTKPHVITCQGSKATVGFGESPVSYQMNPLDRFQHSPAGIDTHIGPVLFQPPELPEETLMPNEHLKAMDQIESELEYSNCIISIANRADHIWSETQGLLTSDKSLAGSQGLDILLPTEEIKAVHEIVLLLEALKCLSKIVEFAKMESFIDNLRPTKAMKTGKF